MGVSPTTYMSSLLLLEQLQNGQLTNHQIIKYPTTLPPHLASPGGWNPTVGFPLNPRKRSCFLPLLWLLFSSIAKISPLAIESSLVY
jgi:hypothetical protein